MKTHLVGILGAAIALFGAVGGKVEAQQPAVVYQFDTLRGSVVDAQGVPVGNAQVEVWSKRGRQYRTQSGPTGQFTLAKLPEGPYTLIVNGGASGAVEQPFLFRYSLAGQTLHVRLSHDIAAPGQRSPGTVTERPTSTMLTGQPVRNPSPSVATRLAAPAVSSSAPLAVAANAAQPNAAGANPAADFSVYSTVIASNPASLGFNISPGDGDGIADNTFIQGGGFTPYDSRLSFTATQDGSATTFIDTDQNPGTDYYSSLANGFFNGAQARVYRYSNGAWQLVRTGVVLSFTAVSSSSSASDHTVTFTTSGPATKQGDAMWLSLDGQLQVPPANQLDPRFTTYAPTWSVEVGSNPTNPSQPSPVYTYAQDAPAEENYNGPAGVPGLSLKLTDSNTEVQGIWQYMQPQYIGNQDGFESGHTYELSVWLKQNGVADGSMTFTFRGLGLTHTFTGVTSQWQKFTWTFQGVANAAAGAVQPSVHFDFNAPGTMYFDNIRMWDTSNSKTLYTWDPRVQSALQSFQPGTMRIWSSFSSSAGSYAFWSLDSWLADEGDSRSSVVIGNQYSTVANQEHLPTSLAYAKQINTIPWLIVSMSYSEQEWSNLIDYLCAPAGQGYAAYRPANHPGPYTADFSTIYVEFGNEEWGTQQTAVNGNYGQWVHYMLSQAIAGKSYFDSSKIKFIGNSFSLGPSFASNASAAAPEVSTFDYFSYTSGDTSLTGDAYYQDDLIQLPKTNKAWADNIVAQQQSDIAAGHGYQIAVYEGGPGTDLNGNQGDTSLAAGVAALDTSLYWSSLGFGPQNYFLFSTGSAPYTSHSLFRNGFVPHPAWEAYQMRNNYARGPMVQVVTNSVPKTADAGAYPLVGAYAFHDTTSGPNVAEVFVISRDLINTTPVTLHFPAGPTGNATLYTLTGDPRGNNDTSLTIPIATSSVAVTQNYTFNMPPGSIYLFSVPTGTWSTNAPVPAAPTGLTANGGVNNVSLSWSTVQGATSYNVYRATTTGGPYTKIGSSSSVAYSDTGATNGTTYFYVVTAVNSGGESGYSNEVSAKPDVAVATFTATAPPIDGTSAAVWNSATTYPYQHKNSGNTPDTGTFKLLWDNTNLYVLATIQDSTSTKGTSVFTGDSVEVYVDGSDTKPGTYGADDFQFAFPWNGTTVTEASKNATAGVRFGQQTITGGYQMTVALPWSTLQVSSPVSGKLVGFDTQVNDATAPTTRLGKIAWWATSDQSYANPSLFGNVVLQGSGTVSAPSAPSGLSASAGNQQVALSWTASSGATSYNVYQGTAAGSESASAVATGITSTGYTVTGLTNGTKYYFTVKAVNTAGTSGASNEASATPATPTAAATPVFSPAAGTYTSAQAVTIADATSASTIYYTTNGSTPTTSSSVYAGAITVSSTQTLKAIATASGYSQSAVATAAYTINTGGGSGSGGSLAYDPFIGAAGGLNGLNDGTGWSGAWQEQSGSTVVPGYNVATGSPLSYSGVTPQGNYAVGGYAYETAGRSLDVTATGAFASYLSGGLIGASGKTVYLGFLIRKDTNDSNAATLTLNSNNIPWYVANTANVAIGYLGGAKVWGIQVNGTVYNSTVPVTVGQTVQIVASITFGATNAVNLYVNPVGTTQPGTASATATTTTSLAFKSLAWQAGVSTGNSSLDEVRFGSSFASVTGSGSVATVPLAPAGLSATAGSGQVALNWTASSGATSYNVYQGTSAGGESTTAVASGITGTSYTVTGLTNGTKYYFTVKAVNTGGTSAASNEASATPAALAYEPFIGATGGLNGLNDGTGWSGAWQQQSGSTVVPGYNVATGSPLSYSGVTPQGNYAVGGYQYQTAGRGLDVSATGTFASYLSGGLIGASGKTVYLSFLIRKDTNDSNPAVLTLTNNGTPWYVANTANVAIGYLGGANVWGIQVNGTTYNSAVPVTAGQTVKLEVAITFGSTNTVQLYVNPPAGSTPPANADATGSTTTSLAFQSLAWQAGYTTGDSSLDEVLFSSNF